MGYVAVKGGINAVNNSEKLVNYYRVKGKSEPIEVEQIHDQLRFAVDRAMSEGSIYAPELAALAVKQAEGDPIEASFIMRAFRATQARNHYSVITDTGDMRVIRRISATFKDIPGGQILGPTRDYTTRLLNFNLKDESKDNIQDFITDFLGDIEDKEFNDLNEKPVFPKVIDILRKEGLLKESKRDDMANMSINSGNDISSYENEQPACDITREGLKFPAPRSARLQVMARGETGGMITLAYTTMRGYGNIHPTLGELRVGYLPVMIKHPNRDENIHLGEVLVTEAEVISQDFSKDEMNDGSEKELPIFTVGYGLCFGHNEEKAISMAILDRAMDTDEPKAPAQDQEFVLSHIDGIEASGFTSHWKLPHYVTFQSVLDRIRKSRENKEVK
ncbi:MAG: carbon-phosphorus lyase complex subunit PhnI [Halanaerobiaceae bacterium]